MKLSDYVIDFIASQGVAHIFELVGGAITHLVDSTVDRKDITCVSVHHEQVAAFAAEGYARINGKLGVAMATSGPGALNLLTGIGSCYFDSVPCLFITGQVNTYEYKFDRPVRQVGFQETDIVSVVSPLTKYAEMVTDAGKIRYHLEKAVYCAQSGRPGPVLLDIPMDIQRAQIDPEKLESFFTGGEFLTMQKEAARCQESDIEEVARLISEARRPVILAGGGIRTGDAVRELGLLTERTGIPVVTSLMGIDAVPGNNPRCFGMIGVYGNRFSNLAVANCDLLLVLGSRLDTRQTGTRPETFARAAKIVHVDVDKHELDSKVKTHLAIQCQVKEFLESLNDRLDAYIKPDLAPWYSVISGYREKYPTRLQEADRGSIDPNHFLEILSGHCGIGDIICVDVGQNQMWAGQSFRLKEGQRMLISGGMGSMGFALPAALGAAKAAPGKRVVVISGDGGIQLNIQDLDTIVSHHLPVKIVILNNGCLGMVRQFQDMYFDGRQQSTVVGYHCPDLIQVAGAYGLSAGSLSTGERMEKDLEKFLGSEGPAFLEVKISHDSCVNPKLLVNCPIEDMSPPLDRDQLRKEMIIECDDRGK